MIIKDDIMLTVDRLDHLSIFFGGNVAPTQEDCGASLITNTILIHWKYLICITAVEIKDPFD